MIAEVHQDALQQALLLMAAEVVEQVAPGGSLAVSLTVEGESAAIRFAAEPCRPPAPAEAGHLRALELAAESLGGSFESHREDRSLAIEISLPLAPAPQPIGDAC